MGIIRELACDRTTFVIALTPSYLPPRFVIGRAFEWLRQEGYAPGVVTDVARREFGAVAGAPKLLQHRARFVVRQADGLLQPQIIRHKDEDQSAARRTEQAVGGRKTQQRQGRSWHGKTGPHDVAEE